MESERGSESIKHDPLAPPISGGDLDHDSKSEADIEIDINKNGSGSCKKSESPHSAFSSLSNSSTEDYLHMVSQMLKKSSTFPVVSPNAREETQSPQKQNNDATGDVSSRSEDLNKKFTIAPSLPVNHATDVSTTQSKLPIQSPPVQVMEKSAGYNLDMVPASIFASTSSSGMHWSTTSIESLFSIQLGNNSFSREQFLMINEDMFTGDFYDSGELNHSGELKKPVEQGTPRLLPLSPIGKLHKVKTMDSSNKPKETKAADGTKKYSSNQDVADLVEEKEPVLEGNADSFLTNRPSDRNGASLVDTTKSSLSKGPSPRQQDAKPAEYTETPKLNSIKKKYSSYWWWWCCCRCYSCCSLPRRSCSSCWCWKWCKELMLCCRSC